MKRFRYDFPYYLSGQTKFAQNSIFVKQRVTMGISEEIKSDNFNNQREKALVNLVYTSNWYRDQYKSVFKKYDLLPQHYNALRIIKGRFPDPICPGEIKEVMLDKGPDVTRLVDKLVKKGMVSRCQNKENRRNIEIRLSDKGAKVLDEMTGQIRAMDDTIFGLTDEEAITLSELLDKMRKSE